MGGCFSGSSEASPKSAPAAAAQQLGAKEAGTPRAGIVAAATTPSRPSASGASAPTNLGRISMSSEKGAENKEHARHSRANSRTSIASLGDVNVPLDKKSGDVPLHRSSDPHPKPDPTQGGPPHKDLHGRQSGTAQARPGSAGRVPLADDPWD